MNIVVVDGFTANPGDLSWAEFEKLGHVTVHARTAACDLILRCKDADAVLTNKVKISREHFEQLPKLNYLGILATGTNIVDLKAAKEHGVVVSNVPAYSTDSVAQLVMSYILHFSFRVAEHHGRVQAGEWVKSQDFSFTCGVLMELKGKTLGIVGLGNIGQKVAELGQAFGMKILSSSRSPKNIQGVAMVDLATLWRESDFITLHCALTPETENLICRDSLVQMKPSAMLINTGRGPLVCEADLAEALNGGRLAGAACDVLSCEPPKADNPLLTARHCLLTPHIAWATLEARTRLLGVAGENLKAYLAGHPQNVVS